MKIKQLALHQAQFVPGLPEFKRTMTLQLYPGLDMKTHQLGVVCRFKGVCFIIPLVNIQCIVMDEGKDD